MAKLDWEYQERRFHVGKPFEIDVGRGRFLHGPCVTRCQDGDYIVAYQDGLDDPGRESVIRQRRSMDGGTTWVDEGIVYDESTDGFGARNPAFGQTPSGAGMAPYRQLAGSHIPTKLNDILEIPRPPTDTDPKQPAISP